MTSSTMQTNIEELPFMKQPLYLQILQGTATVTTIAMFLTGIMICLEIRRRKSAKEISSFPFLMGFLSSACWLRYGFLKEEYSVVAVNAVGSSLMLGYMIFYVVYSSPKVLIAVLVCLDILVFVATCVLIQVFQNNPVVLSHFSYMCSFFNIICFGAPLAGMVVVFKTRCCDTLPLPLIVANFFVSAQWCLFGIFRNHIEIVVPNCIGIVLAVIQLMLFLIFPCRPGKIAPLGRCFACLRFESCMEENLLEPNDVEKNAADKNEHQPSFEVANKDVPAPHVENRDLKLVGKKKGASKSSEMEPSKEEIDPHGYDYPENSSADTREASKKEIDPPGYDYPENSSADTKEM